VERLRSEVQNGLRAVFGEPLRRSQLRELGLRDHDVQRLVRNGWLQRAHGKYIDGAIDKRLATIRCALTAHPRSVVSHRTAAELNNLRVWSDGSADAPEPTGAVWLTCKPGANRRNKTRDDLVLRRATLPPADLRTLQGLPVTSIARTTVDLARELPLSEAMVTVDHALATAVRREELDLVLRRQRRWPGIQKAQRAIVFGDPRSESALESIARALFEEAGLPAPVPQAQFWDGQWWAEERVDFWWPQFRTVVEADGLAKFDAPTVKQRRRILRRAFERDERLADRDLELVHFGWEDAVLRPDQLAERLQAAFARGARRTGATPTWRTADPHDPHHWPRPQAAPDLYAIG
jgi:8-oxo-dGTP pyrophosphatase MutT (NUDIX family)